MSAGSLALPRLKTKTKRRKPKRPTLPEALAIFQVVVQSICLLLNVGGLLRGHGVVAVLCGLGISCNIFVINFNWPVVVNYIKRDEAD